ncbi:tetratricopeptide repeat protein [Falsirhodobacter sp. 20TX0035]|uniref:type III secretion apparatus assembly chaperone SctY n=1 Tax=Falsirhodobacter sp. 20TX0035 TaxID=3022019 RepID=UPI0023311C2C|nr:tetratricopeptide repeat protein [Falsirhodobacter sp. 20TX0035]MDB6454411.1 tetratricopeptide repeat protein [Falsirhodobacter sp. 20TX0035]
MSGKRTDSADLLHSLGYLYLRAGQGRRALVLLLLANQMEPDSGGILRTLTAALIENGSSQRALSALDRLAELEPDHGQAALLLRARALWMLGSEDEARRCFNDYVATRGAA